MDKICLDLLTRNEPTFSRLYFFFCAPSFIHDNVNTLPATHRKEKKKKREKPYIFYHKFFSFSSIFFDNVKPKSFSLNCLQTQL
jgi:hypothetical protein